MFAEDPGAANFIVPIATALCENNVDLKVFSAGKADQIFNQFHISHRIIRRNKDPQKLIQALNPNLIIVGTSENPDTIGLSLIKEARKNQIKTIGLIDAPAYADYRFKGRDNNPLALAPDWLITPDIYTKKLYISLGFPETRIKAFGHPYLEKMIAAGEALLVNGKNSLRRKLFNNKLEDRQIIVFISEVSYGFRAKDFEKSPTDQLRGRGVSTGRTAIVLEEVLDALKSISPKPHIVLRLAPKDQVGIFDLYKDEIDEISQGDHILPLLCVADLVVGLTSMPVYEAALLGKPTLSILPNPEQRHWLPSIQLGLTELAISPTEIREKILNGLKTQSTHRAQKEAILHHPKGATAQIISFIREL